MNGLVRSRATISRLCLLLLAFLLSSGVEGCHGDEYPEFNLAFYSVIASDTPLRITDHPFGYPDPPDRAVQQIVNERQLMLKRRGGGGSISMTMSHFQDPGVNVLVLAHGRITNGIRLSLPNVGHVVLLFEDGKWTTLSGENASGPITVDIEPKTPSRAQVRVIWRGRVKSTLEVDRSRSAE